MERAVHADVEIGTAAIAGVADADALRGRQRDLGIAGKAAHAAILLLALSGCQAQAQAPDLNELALGWARGRYASPLVCEYEGNLVRGVRRVLIAPGPRHSRPPMAKIVFVDMEVAGASRCFTELGGPTPNLKGEILIHLPGHSRPDTAEREFIIALKRRHGFDFDVREGHLRSQPVGGDAAPEAEIVDYADGTAKLHEIQDGTDDARVLAGFRSPRKLVLELTTSEGRALRLPMFQVDAR